MSNVRPFPAAELGEDDGEYVDRRVPADTAAEQAVLNACMHNASTLDTVNYLTTADFYHPAHRLVWDAIGTLAADGKPTNAIAVHSQIEHLGQLRMIRGGDYLWEIGNAPTTAADYFAGIVFDKARTRRASALVLNVQQAIDEGADADLVDKLLTDHQLAEQERTDRAAGNGPSHLLAAALDWTELFTTDYGAVKLLLGQLMAPGQQIAIVGDGKAGKSLFVQEWLWRMVAGFQFLGDRPQAPIRVTYLDAENGRPELQSRMISFGAHPEHLTNLTYLSFPPIRPLDTPGGGQDLLAIAQATRADLIVLDTVSRFISGVENDADTWLNLYRHTTLKLKAAGIGSIRLDHLGKDSERGARGSSAKTQDIDHVWELRAQGGGVLSLKRTHTRTGIGPEEFTILRHGRTVDDQWVPGGTRHEVMTFGERATLLEGSPEWIADQLDRAGVPTTYGRDRLRAECARLGIEAKTSKLETVAKIRKGRENLPPDLPPAPELPINEPAPEPAPSADNPAGQTCPQQVGGRRGQPQADLPAPSPSLRRGQVGQGGDENKIICDLCDQPVNPQWAARGYTTCLICDTTETT